MTTTVINSAHPMFKAIVALLDGEIGEAETGRYVALRAFIDPGRGDIYLESVCNSDSKVCLEAEGEARYTTVGWGG